MTRVQGQAGNVEKLDLAAWRALFAVNVEGTFLCIKHCVPLMRLDKPLAGESSSRVASGYDSYDDESSKGWALTSLSGESGDPDVSRSLPSSLQASSARCRAAAAS